MDDQAAGSLRDNLERLMPPGSRSRAMVGWGVVAWTGIGGAVLLWAAFQVLARFAGLVPYLVMAGLVVLILEPPVGWLARRGMPRGLAATLVFAAAVGLTTLVLVLIIPILVHQGQTLIASSPDLFRKGGSVFDRLSTSSSPFLREAGQTISDWLAAHAGTAPQALNTLIGAGLQLAHFSAVVVVGGLLGFLFLVSLTDTRRGIAALIPRSRRQDLERPMGEARDIMAGYLRARLLVSLVVGVLATIGLWAVHMPFWLVLGIIVGVANIIPMLGSFIGAIPVALVALLTKPPSFLIVALLVLVLAHSVDGYVLSPIVLKRTMNLHPVVILLAALVGAELYGFWGILAAIPVAGLIQLGLREWILPRIRDGVASVSAPGPLPG